MVVAPLRGRGLKLLASIQPNLQRRRSLTGAWIETLSYIVSKLVQLVAPLRGRGLKLSPAR